MSDLLRLATAGSVDDGKSTLVGRLLYDTKSVLADQIDAVTRASVDKGLSTPDLSLLVDGLRAEREQGITIDVAYRYFATPRRTFVLADTPGHVQYTRNTVSGASTAQLVILLVDARKGVISQTRKHAAVLALLGVPRLVLAVNKIDLVDDPAQVFADISAEFRSLTGSLGWAAEDVREIPVSALHGDNVAVRSENTPFYDGPTLIEHLESVPVDSDSQEKRDGQPIGLRFPVQYVIRPRTADFPDYRGYAGQVAAGSVVPGDEVVILPSGTRTTVSRIDTADGELDVAHAGRSVTLVLADDVDVSRGDTIAAPSGAPEPIDQFDATVCWLAEKPLRPGARLLLKHGTRTTQAIVGSLVERLDEQELTSEQSPETLELNEIGKISVRVAEPIVADDYTVNRHTGCFLLIDPAGGNTLAAGLVGDAIAAVELGERV
ncbi:sulfate adenylyltransferase subunit 1 [Rhodococcus sp. OK519]|uniref:sulfate adenylyltransferase subunit 1 n=1 Tax=Rhodococcus sp. OK519 TaxID=2135729 RepID=UPI000D3A501F|nr:sulfate adenylyltransferase subunit 1 [Rhodococcus sp. OK519]